MRKTLALLAMLFGANAAFADIRITSGKALYNSDNPSKVALTFTLDNVEAIDFGGAASGDNARILAIVNLDVCLNQENCAELVPWQNGDDVDRTDEDDLDEDTVLIINDADVNREGGDSDDYEITYSVTLESVAGDAFQVGTEIYLEFDDAGSGDNSELKLTVAEQQPISSQLQDFKAAPSNKSVALSWTKVENVVFADGTKGGTPDSYRVYGYEITADANGQFSTSFDNIANPQSKDANAVVPNCTLTADVPNKSCSFTCDAPGYLNSEKVKATEIFTKSVANSSNAVTFENLKVDVPYAFFPQIEPQGLLNKVSDNSFTAPCALAIPIETYTYAELSGAGPAKQEDPTCFIATAAYGHPLGAELDELRWFRDEVLQDSSVGRFFVDRYYEYSPAIAQSFIFNEAVRGLVRAALWLPVQSIHWYRSAPQTFFSAVMAFFGLLTSVFFLSIRRYEKA